MTDNLITAFKKYHSENPDIYRMFVKFSLQAAERRKNFSAKAVFERIRWETMVSGNDQFKINNNYTAYYARMFEHNYPKHEGFFRKRTIR
jgi:hypothetical protein